MLMQRIFREGIKKFTSKMLERGNYGPKENASLQVWESFGYL